MKSHLCHGCGIKTTFGGSPTICSKCVITRKIEKSRLAFTMYESGLTFDSIGIHFGVTRERARQIVNYASRVLFSVRVNGRILHGKDLKK
jgi:hypothetical protein